MEAGDATRYDNQCKYLTPILVVSTLPTTLAVWVLSLAWVRT